jgi:hypothetical protein
VHAEGEDHNASKLWLGIDGSRMNSPNTRLSGRAVNKLLELSLRGASEMMRCRAAQLWR